MILDSSAAVAAILKEPGGEDVVRHIVNGASISAVNLAELVGVLRRNDAKLDDVQLSIDELELEVLPFDEELAYEAGLLELSTRRRGLSLGDRACLVTAIRYGLPILTADHSWQGLSLDIEIEFFR